MEKCLQSPDAFREHYSDNPLVAKAFYSGFAGLFTGGAPVIATQASTAYTIATTTGMTGFVAHFVSWPLIGEAASAHVAKVGAEAMLAASIGVLPVAILASVGVAATIFVAMKDQKRHFDYGSLDPIAKAVSEIVFLPMLAKYKKVIEIRPEYSYFAFSSAVEKICQWGYKKEYVESLVSKYFSNSYRDILAQFDCSIKEIESLGKKDVYKDYCLACCLPVKPIKKIAKSIFNDIKINGINLEENFDITDITNDSIEIIQRLPAQVSPFLISYDAEERMLLEAKEEIQKLIETKTNIDDSLKMNEESLNEWDEINSELNSI